MLSILHISLNNFNVNFMILIIVNKSFVSDKYCYLITEKYLSNLMTVDYTLKRKTEEILAGITKNTKP